MRVSQKEKEKTHRRIVETAARLVRERGVEKTSVGDVMNAAGLTHGGFYRHFDNRDGLLVAAVSAAFEEMGSALEARFDQQEPAAAAASYQADYLTNEHADHPEIGCPIAMLAGEVARGPDILKHTFGAGVQRAITALAQGMPGSPDKKRAEAARTLAMLAGAIAIARACDAETARSVLAACRMDVSGRRDSVE